MEGEDNYEKIILNMMLRERGREILQNIEKVIKNKKKGKGEN